MTCQNNTYGIVNTKTPREVVLLNTVGGCSWGRCAFCDYCNTFSRNTLEAVTHNASVLAQVTGVSNTLQIVCSANFVELPIATWFDIKHTCQARGIHTLIVETHWLYRKEVAHIRDFFAEAGVAVKLVYGIQTFDFFRREAEWFTGYGDVDAETLANYTDSINLLIGVRGQTLDDIVSDITTAKTYFSHTSIFAYEPFEGAALLRDNELMDAFYTSEVFDSIKDDPSIEILDGLDSRAPDHMGYVGVGAQY